MTDEATALRIQLLGPVRAWRADRQREEQELDLGGPQRRAVLAMLASDGHVSQGELIAGLWGGDPPPSAENAIHVHISGLRRMLEPGRPLRTTGQVLTTSGQAYRLRLAPGSLDTEALERQVVDARRMAASSPAVATRSLDTALALWKGCPLAGIPGPWADIERTRLSELRRTATADRVDMLLQLGSHHQVLAELVALIGQYPLHERFRAQLMLALYRSGRQADALAAFDSARRVLAGQLGVDPGPGLRQLHQQILTGDPALDLPRPAASGGTNASCANCSGSGARVPRRLQAARRRPPARRRPLRATEISVHPRKPLTGMPH